MKKQVLDGQLLIPEKISVPEQCEFCNNTPKENVLYSYICENLNKRICYRCIEKKKRQCAHHFTDNNTIYIGTKKHRCGYGKSMFDHQLGRFCEKSGKIQYLPIYQCKKCYAYIVDGKTYEKHSALLHQCTLIDTKTGKTRSQIIFTGRSLRPPQKITTEIPDHMKWAAKNPYQGGGCSGK